mmetsp:Transcript_79496/g.119508  ORF Transcript_79496/g.119508 Transcript_79496/m.119508 type:complete len:318 (+) Transcript_79496:112-1065(+)|eukprot:CAMPEP_0117000932 /NCGR_PEP_ID=MMETSP0472-20121206/3110_1 /TAXON_ID=693140 ORGANISM="Tiarina fusus, Strain LIS" /NCGR_SAMPLE_ID=MMETSP0472 /ASSEMBLY_ACC=CAM_ASM_000603 /LENGTH=317 /DNA_ID=CAMNT_0004700791 /DNA_START=202 /DNA_END=1155 /DNA_ORIENTATION=-
MGRVAKYKKIKACDPYSKKNRGNVNLNQVGMWGLGDSGRKAKKRSLKAQLMRKTKKRGRFNGDDDGGFDLPPSEKDDFDMKDFRVKKQKVQNPILAAETNKIATETIKVDNNVVATIPKTDEDERKVARVLKVEQKVKESQKKKQIMEATVRQEGESRNAFKKRTKVETRNLIQVSRKINEGKRERKKEFLKNKKKAKGKKGASLRTNNNGDSNDGYQSEDNNNDDDGFVTGERAVAAMQDQVRFGEQAERPPSFRQLPRGAKKQTKKGDDSDGKSTGMTDTEVRAERDAMELLRRKIQAQYSAIKLQRRKNGDFHL